MQRVTRSISVLFLLGFFTLASAQLPPEIRLDAYLLQAEKAIHNGDLYRAQAAIQNILRLLKEHELDLSDEFHFRYAKAADAVDLSDQALESVLKYLVASGREGQHYVEALALMNKVQDRSSREVVASQLSPNIITDAYLLQAEQSIRNGDHIRGRDAVQNIRDLQEQHELDLPNEFHFRYAKAAGILDMPDQALESVLKYLAVSGREGQHYPEALALMNKVQMAVSCRGWDTEEYFKTATLEEVTACLDTGVDLNERNDAGATPLHRAAQNTEDLDVIKALLNAGAYREAQDKDKRTPLYWAVSFKNLSAVKALIDAGANKARAKDKWTPLHWAAAFGDNPDVVKSLINAGADLKAKDKDKRTPLHVAAGCTDNLAIVKVLIDAGADLKAKDKDNWTPLHSAAAYNENPVILKFLIYAGADLKAKAKNKWMPLHVAAGYNENPDILKVLINAGADLEARDNGTLLHVAAGYNENPDILKVLIDAGADLEARDKDKDTPLHWMALYNKNPDILKVLIDAGAHLEAKNKENWTPLHSAARYNKNSDILKVLIDAGADLNARDKNKNTPLHYAAAYHKNPDILKTLIDAGAHLEAKNKENWTPLHSAAASNVGHYTLHLPTEYNTASNNPTIVKVLIDAGANLEAQNRYGFTPLLLAAQSKNPGVIKILIDAGANLEAQDNNGRTALKLATEGWGNENESAAVKVLSDAGARESQEEDGFGKAAAALLGGAAIMYAGKDATDQEAVTEAARRFMDGVLSEQPDGSGNSNSATPSSQSQGGQAQDPMQQALQNLENVCGEKYQGNFADNDHYRFYCMAAFNDYCALKRAQSSDAIDKLRASLQQNCAALKKDGLESKCPYCK